MAVGRCPYPHARIACIDTSAALGLDGVLEVITGAEAAARSGPIGILRPVPGAPPIPHFSLAQETATYEGQPVVSVAATSRHVAEDALELIEIEYEPLPHVSDVVSALAPGAPVIHPGASNPTCWSATRRARATWPPGSRRPTSSSRAGSTSTGSPACRWRPGRCSPSGGRGPAS